MKRIWSKGEVLELFALYRQGQTFKEIGKSFGISGEQIRRLFLRDSLNYLNHKKTKTSKYADWSREKVLEMYDHYRSGHAMDETAAHFALPRNKVRELFAREALDHRQFSKKTKPRKPVRERSEIVKMFALLKKGRTIESIGKSFGISGRRVRQLFVEAGFDYGKYQTRKKCSPKTYNKARVRKMFNLYRAGMVMEEIAKLYGTSRKTITQWFAAEGYDYQPYKKSRTARTALGNRMAPEKGKSATEEVLRFYGDEKLSAREIAILSGTNTMNVTRRLQKSGITVKCKSDAARKAVTFYPELTEKELRRLITEENSTPAKIAAKAGCSINTVYNKLEKFGIDFPHKGGQKKRRLK